MNTAQPGSGESRKPYGGNASLEAATARTLDAVLMVGRKAPTSNNTQPQIFVVVRDAATRAQIVARAYADRASGVLHWPMPWLAEASALVCVLYDTRRKEPGTTGDRTALIGIGAAVESARIAAAATESAWTEWRPSEAADQDLRALLGHPKELECHAVFGLVPERPTFPPPPSLATPFAESYGHADPLLRLGPLKKGEGDPLDVLDRRHTARGHFVSAPLPPEVIRALVAGAARAGRAPGIPAPRLIYVQSPTEIGKLADVMFEIGSALFHDAEYVKQISAWQSFEEAEWRKRGDGILAGGKAQKLLQKSKTGGLWNKIASVLGGSAVDELVQETMSELVREAPLVVTWVLEPAARAPGRRAWAAACIDSGASMMRTLYGAERQGLGAQSCSIMLEPPGEAKLKSLQSIPADHEVVNVVRIGKLDTEDTPPSITWRSDIRRPLTEMVFRERYTGG